MRPLISLGLCLCVVGSATAQTEVIIRRPGQQDQVIHLDSARTKEALVRARVELRKATASIQQRVQDMVGQQLTRQRVTREPVRITTLAMKDAELATHNFMAPMIAQLQELRRQPHLGIVVNTLPRETDKWGAYVNSVTPGSPADKAGILSGDIIVRIAGKSLTERSTKGDDKEQSVPGLRLINIVSQLEAGKPVDVELRRGSQNRTVKVTPIDDDMPTVARLMLDRIPATGNFSYPLPGRELMLQSPDPMAQVESPYPSLFSSGGPASMFYSFGGGGLFANLELAAVNEKLGSYFGTSEGVLVVNTTAERQMFMRSFRTDSAHAGSRSNARTGRSIADTIRIVEGRPAARGSAGAGRMTADSI
ncbi:MAG: PDZ domain-containing protein [Gemmatimonadales bacterium]